MKATAARIAIQTFQFVASKHASSTRDLQRQINYLDSTIDTAMFGCDQLCRPYMAVVHIALPVVSHSLDQVFRLADRICVLEGGKVVELGTHEELMAHGGRYHTMFELQASRFVEETAELEVLE